MDKVAQSRRAGGNEKRAYWLRSKVFRYSKYKAWAEGIITYRVSARGTVRECAKCKAQVTRYSEGQENPGIPLVLCAACGMRGNADRNASLNIGQRLFAHYLQQEKPQTHPLAGRPSKEGGVQFPHAAKGAGRPHTELARHGEEDRHGTARG